MPRPQRDPYPFGHLGNRLRGLEASVASLKRDLLSYAPAIDKGGKLSSAGTQTVPEGHRQKLTERAAAMADRAAAIARMVFAAAARDAVMSAVETSEGDSDAT